MSSAGRMNNEKLLPERRCDMFRRKILNGSGRYLALLAIGFCLIVVSAEAMAETPQIRITNVRDTQFAVSWVTAGESSCSVKYGPSRALGYVAYDDRGQETSSTVHHVTLKHLKPNTVYYFEIVSGGVVYDNRGEPYIYATGPSIIPIGSDLAFGGIQSEDGSPYLGSGIIYLKIKDKDGLGSQNTSAELSVLLEGKGSWYAELINLRERDSANLFDYSVTVDELLIDVQTGINGSVSATVDTGGQWPAPDLVLKRIAE
jgi:hypothetical protein